MNKFCFPATQELWKFWAYLSTLLENKGSIRIRVLSKMERLAVLFLRHQPFYRTKFICIPKNVKAVNIHYVEEFFRGSNVHVPSNVGFLHHYRHWRNTIYDKLASRKVDKTLPEKYGHKIIDHMLSVLSVLHPKCPTINATIFQRNPKKSWQQ